MIYQFVSYPAVVSGSGGGNTLGTPTQVYDATRGGTIVGVINNTNAVFTLAVAPNVTSGAAGVKVYRDGIFQTQGVGKDYTIVGSTITLDSIMNFGQTIDVDYFT